MASPSIAVTTTGISPSPSTSVVTLTDSVMASLSCRAILGLFSRVNPGTGATVNVISSTPSTRISSIGVNSMVTIPEVAPLAIISDGRGKVVW